MEENINLRKQAVEGSFLYEIAMITQRVGGLIFSIVLARLLLPESFGLYNLTISIAVVFFMFVQGGIDKALVRYTSASQFDRDKERSYFNYVFKIKIILLLIAFLLVIILAYPIAVVALKKPVLVVPLVLSSFFFLFSSIEQFFASYFYAIKKLKYSLVREMIYQAVRISLILSAFFFIHSKPSVNFVFAVLIFSSLITLFYVIGKILNIRRDIFTKRKRLQKRYRKKIIRFVVYITLASLSAIFLGNIDTIMLGFLIQDTASVGLYRSAFLLMSSLSGLMAFTAILIPFFVKLKGKKLEKAFNRTLRYMMILAVPASFGLGAMGNYLLVLIYGYEYLGAALSLYFIAPLLALSVHVGIFTELFSAKERPRDTLYLIFTVILLNIILDYLLIKVLVPLGTTFAITGAAVATLVSWTVYAIGLEILARKKLKVKAKTGVIIKPLISASTMLVVLLVLKYYLEDINILRGMFLVVSGILVYFLTLFVIGGIDKRDKEILRILKNKAIGFLHLFKS